MCNEREINYFQCLLVSRKRQKTYFLWPWTKLQLRLDLERIRISKEVSLQSEKRQLISIAKGKITYTVSTERQTFVMEIRK